MSTTLEHALLKVLNGQSRARALEALHLVAWNITQDLIEDDIVDYELPKPKAKKKPAPKK